MAKVRFVSTTPTLLVGYQSYERNPLTGGIMPVSKMIRFERGMYQTDKEEEIEAIRNSFLFGKYIFEVKNKEDESKRNTGTPEIKPAKVSVEPTQEPKKKRGRPPKYISNEK